MCRALIILFWGTSLLTWDWVIAIANAAAFRHPADTNFTWCNYASGVVLEPRRVRVARVTMLLKSAQKCVSGGWNIHSFVVRCEYVLQCWFWFWVNNFASELLERQSPN